jgi:hypothetical protein
MRILIVATLCGLFVLLIGFLVKEQLDFKHYQQERVDLYNQGERCILYDDKGSTVIIAYWKPRHYNNIEYCPYNDIPLPFRGRESDLGQLDENNIGLFR